VSVNKWRYSAITVQTVYGIYKIISYKWYNGDDNVVDGKLQYM